MKQSLNRSLLPSALATVFPSDAPHLDSTASMLHAIENLYDPRENPSDWCLSVRDVNDLQRYAMNGDRPYVSLHFVDGDIGPLLPSVALRFAESIGMLPKSLPVNWQWTNAALAQYERSQGATRARISP